MGRADFVYLPSHFPLDFKSNGLRLLNLTEFAYVIIIMRSVIYNKLFR